MIDQNVAIGLGILCTILALPVSFVWGGYFAHWRIGSCLNAPFAFFNPWKRLLSYGPLIVLTTGSVVFLSHAHWAWSLLALWFILTMFRVRARQVCRNVLGENADIAHLIARARD